MAETYPPDLRLRHLRESAGIKMAQLAIEVGVTAHHLRMVEVGGRQPSIELAHRVARALARELGRQVQVDEFFTPLALRKQSA